MEAASNFLLTVMLAGAHAAGLSLIRSSVVISLVCTAATLLLLAWCVRRTTGPWGLWAPFALAAMTLVCRNVTNGLETSLYGLLLLVAVALYLHGADTPTPNRRGLFLSSLVFALVALTRPEGPIYMLALGALRGWELLGRWRRPVPDARMAGAPPVAGCRGGSGRSPARIDLRTELPGWRGFSSSFSPTRSGASATSAPCSPTPSTPRRCSSATR